MPLIQVSTDGENMIIIMGNVDIRAWSICLSIEQAWTLQQREARAPGWGDSALAQNRLPDPLGGIALPLPGLSPPS